jgi:hypothetical protein
MPRVIAAIGVCLGLSWWAAGGMRAQVQSQQESKEQQPAIDVNKLPIAPERLQRKLRESIEREERIGNTIHFNIDVFGLAPRLQLFSPEDNLQYGPTRFTAPTQREMMDMMTPQEFRSPVMDFNNLFRFLQDRSSAEKK